MMNPQQDHAERLSAFLDGELAADEVDALLEALENPACRDQLGRFASCSIQRSNGGAIGSRATGSSTHCDISDAVLADIRAESSSGSRPAAGGSKVVSLVGRMSSRLRTQRTAAVRTLAAAASIAALSVMVVPLMNTSPENNAVSDVATNSLGPASVATASRPDGAAGASASEPVVSTVAFSEGVVPDSERRELVIPVPRENIDLNQLYLQHARFRGGYALAAPVSYGRVGVKVPATEQESR